MNRVIAAHFGVSEYRSGLSIGIDVADTLVGSPEYGGGAVWNTVNSVYFGPKPYTAQRPYGPSEMAWGAPIGPITTFTQDCHFRRAIQIW